MKMGKNRKTVIVIWIIGFALSVFLLLVIPEHLTSSIYLTLAFDVVAFVSSLILWLGLFKSRKAAKEQFYVSLAMTMSAVYLVIQFIICVAEGLLVDKISFRVTLILNFVTTAVMWILILSTLISKNHAQRVDSRQIDHHIEL